MSNYQRGARVEIAAMDALGALGYDVVRSAGSKGAADLVAWSGNLRLVVQAKLNRTTPVTPAERRELFRLAYRLVATPLVVYRDQDPDDGRRTRLVWRRLTGPGPKEWLPYLPEEAEL